MRMAIEEARQGEAEGEVPIGAVLVLEDRTTCRSHNQPIALSDPTAHAEILVLRAAAAKMGNFRLPESTLYVTLEPCVMCAGALLQARIKRLVYGAEDAKGGGVRSLFSLLEDKRLNHQVEITAGVLADPCREVLQQFFQERR